MNRRIIVKSLLICLILSIVLCFSKVFSEPAVENKKNILSLDLSKNDNILLLDKFLSGENILNYFKVRQKLIYLPYEELCNIRERTRNIGSIKKVNGLIDEIIIQKEKLNIYLLVENIIINNVPLLIDSPFYNIHSEDLKITDLRPYAEHVYFYNLRMKYKRNNLFKKQKELWINPKKINTTEIETKKQNRLFEKINSLSFTRLKDEATQTWSYGLKNDNLTDYNTALRQWIKGYEENALYPVVYQGAVLLRNEYRLFCLDRFSGKKIWSFTLTDKTDHEFYQTLRHPHHNSYGYEFLLEKDIIFTELDGKIAAVSIKDILNPDLLWIQHLGEYTVCTKPIKNNDILIVGLINARMELWICGLDCNSGSLEWSTYVGTSCFLSPVCTISAITGEKVFIGTNHGVLICLDSNDGEIIWLRKYTPKRYSLFDYWFKGHFTDNFIDGGGIKFDSQFAELGDDGFLYYKPRESDYLYIINANSGEIEDKILVDSKRYYILKAYNGKAVLLGKKDIIINMTELKIIDLTTGKQINSLSIRGGPLKGINYANKDEILFRLGETIHFLRIYDNELRHAKVDIPVPGWLLPYNRGSLFVAENRMLYCLNPYEQRDVYLQTESNLSEYVSQRKRIKNNFIQAIQSETNTKQIMKLQEQILSDIMIMHLPLEEILPIIFDNISTLKHPCWNSLFIKLQSIYGREKITYRDIEMTFGNFIYEKGLVTSDYYKKGKQEILKNKRGKEKQDFQIQTPRLSLLPVEVIKGPKLLDFFLLLNRSQLLCVNDNGDILWSKKVFYNPKFSAKLFGEYIKGMYGDYIRAYLYNTTIIINDGVNVIAMDAHDGSSIWSMTSKGKTFEKEKLSFNEDELFKKYGIKKTYLKNVMPHTIFFDNNLIIIRGNKIYSVNPMTGYCNNYKEVDIESAIEVAVSGGYIYIISPFLNSIKILDKRLNIVGNFLLNFIKEKGVYPEILLINNYIIISTNSKLYLIDRTDGKLTDIVNMDDSEQYWAEVYEDNLIVVVPFREVRSYSLGKKSLMINWKVDLALPNQKGIWKFPGKKKRYYVIVDKHMMLPFKKEDKYFMVSINLENGEKLWEKQIEQISGLFYYLSNFLKIDKKLKFIITTVCGEETEYSELHIFGRNAIRVYTNSKLVELNCTSGETAKVITLPGFRGVMGAVFGENDLILGETEKNILYSIHNSILKVEAKINGYL